jgi:hypothetical protein
MQMLKQDSAKDANALQDVTQDAEGKIPRKMQMLKQDSAKDANALQDVTQDISDKK